MIRKSTNDDIVELEQWLHMQDNDDSRREQIEKWTSFRNEEAKNNHQQDDNDEVGKTPTFFSNFNMILRTHFEGALFVFVNNEKPLGFIISSPGIMSLIEVKRGHQKKGIGTKLIDYAESISIDADKDYIRIEQINSAVQDYVKNYGYLILKNYGNDPDGFKMIYPDVQQQIGEMIDVIIRFYPRSKKWSKDVEPACVLKRKGWLKDDILTLNKRASNLEYIKTIADFDKGGIVSYEILDGEIILDEAFYDKAKSAGFKTSGFITWIDKIILS